jgi:pimeloyl-ACP methyl ester carboxylesterase
VSPTDGVNRSTLTLPVMLPQGPGAVDVVLDDDPAIGDQAPRVLLMHGFARGPRVLDELVDELVAAGVRVVRPHIRSFKRKAGMTDPGFIAAAAEAALTVLRGSGPLVVMGHSAGGAGAAHAAGHLIAQGVVVAGVVLVDPNEGMSPMLIPALPAIVAKDARALRLAVAEPGRCNRQGLTPRLVADEVPGFVGLRMVGGTHCEIEGAAADLVCRGLCGGASDPQRSARLRALITGWVLGLSAGDARGLPGDALYDDLVSQGYARVL